MEMESGSNKETQFENKNEEKSVINTIHCLSKNAVPLLLPKSGQKCCILSVLGPVSRPDHLICSCDLYNERQVKKREREGKGDSFAPEL